MTYKENFVAEVKCNGKILRVRDGAVRLPFGSEYSILLKNLNSRRASVKIHIDGQDVLDYSSLILDPNSSTELKGFLRGNTASNRFKFIEKTEKIQDHRGDKIDDGLIRIEFAFEKKTVLKREILTEEHHHHHHHYDWNYRGFFTGNSHQVYGSSTGDKSSDDPLFSSNVNSVASSNLKSSPTTTIESMGIQPRSVPVSDQGITVKGSECNQEFMYGSIGVLEPAEVIVIQLKGATDDGSLIAKPLTVKTKLQCSSCGKKSKSTFKFCPECGTFLE